MDLNHTYALGVVEPEHSANRGTAIMGWTEMGPIFRYAEPSGYATDLPDREFDVALQSAHELFRSRRCTEGMEYAYFLTLDVRDGMEYLVSGMVLDGQWSG
jgi:hypothetical protein